MKTQQPRIVWVLIGAKWRCIFRCFNWMAWSVMGWICFKRTKLAVPALAREIQVMAVNKIRMSTSAVCVQLRLQKNASAITLLN